MLVHAWLAGLGLAPLKQQSFWDLTLYRYWMWLGIHEGQWPVLSGDWVYPAGALLPMLLPSVGGTGRDGLYLVLWCVMVAALDAAAVAMLTRRGRRLLGAWWWLAFLVLLGPIAMGRLDAVVVPLVVAALLVGLAHPRVASVLLTAGAWIKVAPGPLLAALFLAVRRPWRDVVVPAAALSLALVGLVVMGGGAGHVASFLGAQGTRGLQIESPGATPWVLLGLVSGSVDRYVNRELITWEIRGPGSNVMADFLGVAFALALVAGALLLWWCRQREGERFWHDEAARAQLLVRGAMLLTLVTIVFNKVGSPQYMTWLAAPVAVALALRLPGWRRTALVTLGVGLATQLVFPWFYSQITGGGPVMSLVLAARNVALVWLLVVTVAALVRDARARETTALEPDEEPGLEARPAR